MSDETECTQVYLEYLRENGYRPWVDGDGDVVFKYEGKTFLIFVDEDDLSFFRLVFPNFWPIEDEAERVRAWQAATEATASTKVAKVFLVEDDVWASAELFVGEPSDFEAVFSRCVDAVVAGVNTFATHMRSSV
jgi:hypothetical protein